MSNEWLRKIKEISSQRDPKYTQKKLDEECLEYIKSGSNEEVVDLFNISAIVLFQKFGDKAFGEAITKLAKRSSKYADKI